MIRMMKPAVNVYSYDVRRISYSIFTMQLFITVTSYLLLLVVAYFGCRAYTLVLQEFSHPCLFNRRLNANRADGVSSAHKSILV